MKFTHPAMDALIERAASIMESKGRDYSGPIDPLASIKRTAERLGLEPRQVIGVYLSKQVDALTRFLKDGTLDSEGVESRMVDVINYVLLLSVLVDPGDVKRLVAAPSVQFKSLVAEPNLSKTILQPSPSDPKYGTVEAMVERKKCRGCAIEFNAAKDFDGMCFACRQRKSDGGC